MSRWIKQTDVAKIIRKDLKNNFPKTKFSVRCSSYSMGGHINVDWIDGPSEEQIKEHIDKYKSKGFDGMIDLEFYYRHYLLPDGTIMIAGSEGTEGSRGYYPKWQEQLPEGAEEVSLGTGYLFCRRELSREKQMEYAKIIAAEEGLEIPETEEEMGKSFTYLDRYYNYWQLVWAYVNKLDLTDAKGIKPIENYSGATFESYEVY